MRRTVIAVYNVVLYCTAGTIRSLVALNCIVDDNRSQVYAVILVGLQVDQQIAAVCNVACLECQTVGLLLAGVYISAGSNVGEDVLQVFVKPFHILTAEQADCTGVRVVPCNGADTVHIVCCRSNCLIECLDGFFVLVIRCGVYAVLVGIACTVFTDHNAIAIVSKLGLEVIEILFHLAQVCGSAPCFPMSPGGSGVCNAERRRFIVVYGNRQHIGVVLRHGEAAGQCLCGVVAVCGADQQTVFVVAAGCTDGVYKRLIIGHGIAGGEADFVHALEYQMLVIAFKVGRDLLPQLFKCCDLGGILFPVLIVVSVDDRIHTVIHAVVYNFLNSCQILICNRTVKRIHLCGAGSTSHIPPGDRDPDGVEASLLDFLDHVFGRCNVAPSSFKVCRRGIAGPSVGRIQSVAQIPAQTHVLHHLYRSLVCRRCNRGSHRQCSGHGQPDCRSRHGAEQFLHKLHVIELLIFFV